MPKVADFIPRPGISTGIHYDVPSIFNHVMKHRTLRFHLQALLMTLIGLALPSAHGLSLGVPKLLIDSTVSKKFPKEKYGVKLDNPVLQLSQERQKIELCGQWSSKLLQKGGDFCIDFQPQWNKDTGEVQITKVQLLKLTAGDEKALPAAVASALNASLLQLLDGTPVYKVPETVGKHLESIDVQNSSIRLNF